MEPRNSPFVDVLESEEALDALDYYQVPEEEWLIPDSAENLVPGPHPSGPAGG